MLAVHPLIVRRGQMRYLVRNFLVSLLHGIANLFRPGKHVHSGNSGYGDSAGLDVSAGAGSRGREGRGDQAASGSAAGPSRGSIGPAGGHIEGNDNDPSNNESDLRSLGETIRCPSIKRQQWEIDAFLEIQRDAESIAQKARWLSEGIAPDD